jgi:hypothetical protein
MLGAYHEFSLFLTTLESRFMHVTWPVCQHATAVFAGRALRGWVGSQITDDS